MTDSSGKDLHAEGGAWADNQNPIDLRDSSSDGETIGGVCAVNGSSLRETYAFHPGGANAVFSDGSVHCINQENPNFCNGRNSNSVQFRNVLNRIFLESQSEDMNKNKNFLTTAAYWSSPEHKRLLTNKALTN